MTKFSSPKPPNDLRAASQQHGRPLPAMTCGEAAPGGLLTQESHDQGLYLPMVPIGDSLRDIEGVEVTLASGHEG